MKRILVFTSIISIFFIFSCRHNDTSKNYDKSLKLCLLDSLKRYSNLSEGLLTDDSLTFSVIISKANDKKIAAIAIAFKTLYLYEMQEKQWIQIDSIPFDTYASSIKIADINNDKFDDLIIYGHEDGWGNNSSYVFIGSKLGKYKYREDIVLCNLIYEENMKLIKSSEEGGCYAYRCKEYYHWVGDSLKLLRGIEINPDQTDNDIVRFYTLKNNEKYIYKVMKDNGCIYDTALWKGKY